MDYEGFLQELPGLYHDWGTATVRPRSDRFQAVLQRVRGMTTANVLQLLNAAVAHLEPDESYCEIGCFQGATLIGALLDQPERRAYAADNFSEFDAAGQNQRLLLENLAAFALGPSVRFANQDFEDYFRSLRTSPPQVGVYLYDGAHDYRSQLLGLLLAVPFLAKRALLVVDDSNCPTVQQATWDFMAVRPECRLLLELPTPCNGHPSFWNGVFVLGWDSASHNGYSSDTFRRGRQAKLLESLDVLQQFNFHLAGNTLQATPV